jgi:hypothetical protein
MEKMNVQATLMQFVKFDNDTLRQVVTMAASVVAHREGTTAAEHLRAAAETSPPWDEMRRRLDVFFQRANAAHN